MKIAGIDFGEMDKRNKIILSSGLAVVSLAILTTIVSLFFTPKAPDPKKLDSRTRVAYMASKQFARLPEKEKVKYMRSAGRSRQAYRQLSSLERQAISRNTQAIMFKRIKERTNKFFQMSEEEQNKYLDERIAQQDRWRKARKARQAQQNNKQNSNRRTAANTNNNRGGNRNARRQGFLENMDSTTRAQMNEIYRRMRERRKQLQNKS